MAQIANRSEKWFGIFSGKVGLSHETKDKIQYITHTGWPEIGFVLCRGALFHVGAENEVLRIRKVGWMCSIPEPSEQQAEQHDVIYKNIPFPNRYLSMAVLSIIVVAWFDIFMVLY